jgi:hypothetical protein
VQIRDEAKLQAFIDKVLTPMAAGLRDEPALGGYDIANEPDLMVRRDQGTR